MTESVEFETMVAATGNNTGIVVPDELIERLGAGRRPAVVVNLNGSSEITCTAVAATNK